MIYLDMYCMDEYKAEKARILSKITEFKIN